ncbi:hypothetical protein [Deinococcus alpinitundrae]|uniref:hypothetical protein n=1 Tax=Deinococcus alpinitundrae TaxID=468913 RepID=UPI00137B6B02|nr:hypothetical protein [Deinococcus alpinitundrae]
MSVPEPLQAAPPPPATFRRLRGLYLLGLGALVLPGVVIGLPMGSLLRPGWALGITWLLAGVALLCSLLSLGLAWRQSRHPEPGSILSAAVLLASAPAVPLLMACALWRRVDALTLLLPLGALALLAGWALLRSWAVPIADGPAQKAEPSRTL